MKTLSTKELPPSRSLPGPARGELNPALALPNCFSRSWKTSAAGLSTPYSLRNQKSAESKPPIPGLVLKAAWSLASHGSEIKTTLHTASCAAWPGHSKGYSSKHNVSGCTESATVIAQTSAAKHVPWGEADLSNNQTWKIRSILIAWQRRGASAAKFDQHVAAFLAALPRLPAIYAADFNRQLWPLRFLRVSKLHTLSFRPCLRLYHPQTFLLSSFWNFYCQLKKTKYVKYKK